MDKPDFRLMPRPDEPPDDPSWRIKKEIPVTFIIVLALQTVGIAVWFGIMWARILEQDVHIEELRTERYTKDEARRDREINELRVIAAQQLTIQRFDSLDARLDRLNNTIERHLEGNGRAAPGDRGSGSVRGRWSGEGDSRR